GTDNGGSARLTGSVESLRSWQEGDRLGGGGVYVDDDDFDDFGEEGDYDEAEDDFDYEDDDLDYDDFDE
ncbi:MAG TPA: hypothetical protein PLP41_04145, partial [Treponemataceae bacterium]|nr:hypothetical protein [Treponemataceae bacterium]